MSNSHAARGKNPTKPVARGQLSRQSDIIVQDLLIEENVITRYRQAGAGYKKRTKVPVRFQNEIGCADIERYYGAVV